MLRTLLDRVAAPLTRTDSAFPLLSAAHSALQSCRRPSEAVATVERYKPQLFDQISSRLSIPEAQALTLKALNILLIQRHLAGRSAAVASRPAGLVVDPSNTCRLGCPGCVHSEHQEKLATFDWPNGTLQQDRLEALLSRYGPYAVGVYFCNYGEPLLNLATPRLIRAAKRRLLGAALSTSLSAKRFDAEAYVESGLDFMVISCDGVTQEVYEQFRRNGELDLVLANIEKLVAAKRKLGKHTPALSWNFLAFEHNAHEIPAAARMARRLGVNQFRVVEPFDVTWDDPSIRPARARTGVRRLDWVSAGHRRENWNPFPDEVDAGAIARAYEQPWSPQGEDAFEQNPGHTCRWLYQNMIMDANGRILPCCGAPARDRDLVFAQFDGAAGDVFNSPKYRSARSCFADQASSSVHCARCEWDQTTVNIGGREIERYFRAADPHFFGPGSWRLLSA